MPVIAVVNLKGGVGKTTTSVYLTLAGQRLGYQPLLADANPDGSATEWIEDSLKREWMGGVLVANVPSERLIHQLLETPLASSELVVIDTPPNSEAFARAAMSHADVIVIPTRCGGTDIERVIATFALVPPGVPCGVVICAARMGTKNYAQALEAWSSIDLDVWGTVPQRVKVEAGLVGRPDRVTVPIHEEIFKIAIEKAGVTHG